VVLRDTEDLGGLRDAEGVYDIGERVHADIATLGSDSSQHGT
jgi:hypothetical protein